MSARAPFLPAHPLEHHDPTHLQAHVGHCAVARGALHRVRGAFEVVDAFVMPHFLSTLAVLLAFVAALLWLTT